MKAPKFNEMTVECEGCTVMWSIKVGKLIIVESGIKKSYAYIIDSVVRNGGRCNRINSHVGVCGLKGAYIVYPVWSKTGIFIIYASGMKISKDNIRRLLGRGSLPVDFSLDLNSHSFSTWGSLVG